MVCPKCGSSDVLVQAVPITKSIRHGWAYWVFFIWLFDLLLWLFLFIPRLILQLFKRNRIVTRTRTVAVCQNCGRRWRP